MTKNTEWKYRGHVIVKCTVGIGEPYTDMETGETYRTLDDARQGVRDSIRGAAEYRVRIAEIHAKAHDYLSEIGKRGGSAKSESKAKASVENGKKGGRPKAKKD